MFIFWKLKAVFHWYCSPAICFTSLHYVFATAWFNNKGPFEITPFLLLLTGRRFFVFALAYVK